MMDSRTPVTQAEAADALQEISSAQQRSRTLYGYRSASPHLILWGIIWAIGYGISPWPRLGWIWLILTAIGIVGSYRIAAAQRRGTRTHPGRYIASLAAVGAFILALFLVLQPRSANQAEAIIPLLVSMGYMLHGIFYTGVRMWLTGLAVGALTVAGFFWMPQDFVLWLAVTAGGGLIVGGVWLRSL